MPQAVKIEYKGHSPKMPRRDQNAILRDSYEDLGGQFREKNLPRRFTVAGGRMLGYAKRSPRHEKNKRRLFGHNLPMVHTGDSRRRALSSLTRIVARATKGEGKLELRLNVPTLNFRRAKGPNLREEIERIATREIGPLERHLENVTTQRFDKYKESQTFSG